MRHYIWQNSGTIYEEAVETISHQEYEKNVAKLVFEAMGLAVEWVSKERILNVKVRVPRYVLGKLLRGIGRGFAP